MGPGSRASPALRCCSEHLVADSSLLPASPSSTMTEVEGMKQDFPFLQCIFSLFPHRTRLCICSAVSFLPECHTGAMKDVGIRTHLASFCQAKERSFFNYYFKRTSCVFEKVALGPPEQCPRRISCHISCHISRKML